MESAPLTQTKIGMEEAEPQGGSHSGIAEGKKPEGFSKRVWQWVSKHKLAVLVALFVFALISIQFRDLFIITILMAVGSFSQFYKRFLRGVPVGAELIIFTTVTCSIFYGPFLGAVFGAITTFFSSIVALEVNLGTLLALSAASLVGFVSYFIILVSPSFNFVLLGVLMTLLFDSINQSLALLAGEQKAVTVFYIIAHLIFNFAVFRFFSPIILAFLGLQ